MAQQTPSYGEMARVFGRIGILSFGGPAAQIALMHRELVDERPWLTERRFLNALSFCMLLPGPEAMQLATYCGWRLRGVTGGLIGGGLFVIPGAIVIMALSLIYAIYGDVPLLQSLFLGVKAAVVIIVIQALLKVAKRALNMPDHWAIAALSFAAIYGFGLPFPLIILLAALWGALRYRNTTEMADAPELHPHRETLRTIAIWGTMWLTPLAVLWLTDAQFLLEIGLFFSRLAVVTFGGAYAVLAYMTQAVVQEFGWLTTPQMMDGLGLAETTPGPLILVTQFVGFLAGYGIGGIGLAVVAALVTLWCTFIPCFLWIFTGAPYIEWLSTRPRLTGALSGITAAVVGVILNLSIWFSVHVFFADVRMLDKGGLNLLLPIWSSLDFLALALAILAGYLLLARGWSVLATLASASIASLFLTQIL